MSKKIVRVSNEPGSGPEQHPPRKPEEWKGTLLSPPPPVQSQVAPKKPTQPPPPRPIEKPKSGEK